MCLAVPAKIIEILPDQMAWVDLDGIQKLISTELLENLNVGDYVIVHVGHALTVIDPVEAQETLTLFAEMKTHNEIELRG